MSVRGRVPVAAVTVSVIAVPDVVAGPVGAAQAILVVPVVAVVAAAAVPIRATKQYCVGFAIAVGTVVAIVGACAAHEQDDERRPKHGDL